MTKLFILMFFAVLCASLGDVFLSIGMKQVGEVEWRGIIGTLKIGLQIVKNPYVLLGTATLCVFFGCYLSALSLGELSFVMPLTAMSYVVVAIIAKFFLNEAVTIYRILGIILITAGVFLVSISHKPGEEKLLPQNQQAT